jgi:hypothetical protein
VGSEGLLSSLIPGPVPTRRGLSLSSAAVGGSGGHRRGHSAPPDLEGVRNLTELMQAHRQWMSRVPDERFTSLIDMQAFERRVRDNSRSHVLSSRKVNLLPVEDDPRALQAASSFRACRAATRDRSRRAGPAQAVCSLPRSRAGAGSRSAPAAARTRGCGGRVRIPDRCSRVASARNSRPIKRTVPVPAPSVRERRAIQTDLLRMLIEASRFSPNSSKI